MDARTLRQHVNRGSDIIEDATGQIDSFLTDLRKGRGTEEKLLRKALHRLRRDLDEARLVFDTVHSVSLLGERE